MCLYVFKFKLKIHMILSITKLKILFVIKYFIKNLFLNFNNLNQDISKIIKNLIYFQVNIFQIVSYEFEQLNLLNELICQNFVYHIDKMMFLSILNYKNILLNYHLYMLIMHITLYQIFVN